MSEDKEKQKFVEKHYDELFDHVMDVICQKDNLVALVDKTIDETDLETLKEYIDDGSEETEDN